MIARGMRLLLPLVVAAAALVAVAQACGGTTSDTVCTPDETICAGSCTALYKDPDNCGACSNTCASGTVCFKGTCATSCGGGTIQCGQSCVDPNVDRDNCGGCNAACGSGLACVGGTCSSSCGQMQTLCVLDGGVAYCADTQSDNANCGVCESQCSAGLVCADGMCSNTCASDQTWCAPDAGAPYCAKTSSDNANCGGCGNECSVGALCIMGSCQSVCDDSQTLCIDGGSKFHCADLQSDPANCGKCSNVCGSNASCSSGSCMCNTGYTSCSGTCVDLSTDTSNCGACGTTCAGTCSEGRCITTLVKGADPSALTADGTNVYWVDLGTGYAHQVVRTGGTPMTLGVSSAATAIVVDSVNAYWNASGSYVDTAPIGGGTTTQLTIDNPASSIVTDGTSVYYDNSYADTIEAVPVGGGSSTVLVTTSTDCPCFLRINGSWLYWEDGSGIHRASTGSGTPTTLTTLSYFVPLLDVDDSNIYFTERESMTSEGILSMTNTGSSTAVILVPTTVTPDAIVTDGVAVYYGQGGGGSGVIAKVPVAGGAITTLASGLYLAAYIPLAVDQDSVYFSDYAGIHRITPK